MLNRPTRIAKRARRKCEAGRKLLHGAALVIRTYADLPGWIFEMGETSPGMYQVTAKNTLGQVVGAGGPDPDYLIAKVKAEAATLALARVNQRANDTT
jgi:hypothetical protein